MCVCVRVSVCVSGSVCVCVSECESEYERKRLVVQQSRIQIIVFLEITDFVLNEKRSASHENRRSVLCSLRVPENPGGDSGKRRSSSSLRLT